MDIFVKEKVRVDSVNCYIWHKSVRREDRMKR